MRTLCFTGRRPKDLFGYGESKRCDYEALIDFTVKKLEYFYEKGVRDFISGGAQGFDQCAFWAVEKLKERHPDVKNILYIPFPGQDAQWPEDGLFGKKEYQKMCLKADETVYIGKHYSKAGLLTRNHHMVDASDVVLGLYPDDSFGDSYGGTAECLRYAVRKNREIYQLTYDKYDRENLLDTIAMKHTYSSVAGNDGVRAIPVAKINELEMRIPSGEYDNLEAE